MARATTSFKGMCWCCGLGSFALRVIEGIGWLCPTCFDDHKAGQCRHDHKKG